MKDKTMKKILLSLVLAFGLLSVSLAPLGAQRGRVVLVAHDSFNVSESVWAEFEAQTGLSVEVILAGDAGVLVNQAVLSAGAPQGDLLFGVDNTFLSRALGADLFIPYEAPALAGIPAEFQLDPQFRVTPIDYGDVCLNYDMAYFAENDLPLPASLADLTRPAYKGLLVTPNPATSSPGLAFLLATIATFGTEGDYTYLDFWADMVANEVLVVPDWTTAYYTDFSLREGGERPLVVSYASSPPAEMIFSEPPLTEPITGSIVADGTCFRQIEFAGILRGAKNPEGAQALLDFMLTETFQADVPLQMFVFPVNPEVELPPIFAEYATLAENPATLPPADIEAQREAWIEAWTDVVLR
jgi:thiamine transport system substrate-binding protein